MKINVKNRINKHFITIFNDIKSNKNSDNLFVPQVREEEIILNKYPCEFEDLNLDFNQHMNSFNANIISGKKVYITYDECTNLEFSNGMKVMLENSIEKIMGTIAGYKWYYNINILYLVVKIDSLSNN